MPKNYFQGNKKICLIALSLSLLTFSGCFDFSGKLKQKRSDLIAQKEDLKNELRKNISLLDQKDMLRQELNRSEQRLHLYKEYKAKMKER